jgi:hypothetical protein
MSIKTAKQTARQYRQIFSFFFSVLPRRECLISQGMCAKIGKERLIARHPLGADTADSKE